MPKSPEGSSERGNGQESEEQFFIEIQESLQKKYPDQGGIFTEDQYAELIQETIKKAEEEKNQELLKSVIDTLKKMQQTPMLSGLKNHGWIGALNYLQDLDYSTDNGWETAKLKIQQLIEGHEEKEESIKEHIEEVRSGLDDSIEKARSKGETAVEMLLLDADMSMGNYIDDWTLLNQPVEHSVSIFLHYVPDIAKLIKLRDETGFGLGFFSMTEGRVGGFGKLLIDRVNKSDMPKEEKEKTINQIRKVVNDVMDVYVARSIKMHNEYRKEQGKAELTEEEERNESNRKRDFSHWKL